MALIAFVALGPHGVRARRKLEATFWGEREEKQAKDSLRRELSNCRKALRNFGADPLLEIDMQRVALDLDIVEVDALTLAHSNARSRPLHAVRGELLEGIDLRDCDAFEDWLRCERERIQTLLDEVADTPASTLPDPPPDPEPGKPTLAVLPFAMMDARLEDWCGVAISEALALCLSEVPQLLVISHSTTAEAARGEVSRIEIAKGVGARYLIDGSCFPHEEGLRVIVKIVDGETGEQIWTGEFVNTQADFVSRERAIAAAVAPQIWSVIDTSERRRFLSRVTPVRSNYEKFWKANALYRTWQKDDVATAAQMAAELVELDPGCPWALSLAALTHALAHVLGALPAEARERALGYCETGIRVGSDNVETLGYCAGALLLAGGDLERAGRVVDGALLILPDHQPTLFWGGWGDLLRGEPTRARHRFETALRINPASGARGQMLCGIGYAHMMEGQFAEAAADFARSLLIAPDFPLAELGSKLATADEAGPPRKPVSAAFLRTSLENLPAILKAGS